MKERKTRKLTCIVTGRALLATKEYYERKVKKIGSEDKLHKTYICKEAKDLLKKGISVNKIREMLNVDTQSLTDIPQDIINEALAASRTSFRRIHNYTSISNMINTKTDEDVKVFINNIIKNG